MSVLLEYVSKTEGYFDFSLGRMANGDIRPDEKTAFIDTPFQERMRFDPAVPALELLHPLCFIDSNSFGKGYTLDSLKNILKSRNINDSFISFGGSSVLGLGSHSASDYWPAGIRGFSGKEKNVYTFSLSDSFLSVSGNTLNNRSKYPDGHILDPVSGKLVSKLEQICVSGPTALETEILSTALFAAPGEKSREIAKRFPDFRVIRLSYNEENEQTIIEEY